MLPYLYIAKIKIKSALVYQFNVVFTIMLQSIILFANAFFLDRHLRRKKHCYGCQPIKHVKLCRDVRFYRQPLYARSRGTHCPKCSQRQHCTGYAKTGQPFRHLSSRRYWRYLCGPVTARLTPFGALLPVHPSSGSGVRLAPSVVFGQFHIKLCNQLALCGHLWYVGFHRHFSRPHALGQESSGHHAFGQHRAAVVFPGLAQECIRTFAVPLYLSAAAFHLYRPIRC